MRRANPLLPAPSSRWAKTSSATFMVPATITTAPEVHISARLENDYWNFNVRDNGIGIDTEYKERIFGLFEYVHGLPDPLRQLP